MKTTDATIIGPLTPVGRSAIAGARIAGSEALAVAGKLIEGPQRHLDPRVSHLRTFTFGDSGLITFFPGPHSFTGDDVVEIFVHGSPASLSALIDAGLSAGAVLAAPGEFTMRAFLNGKIDLTQAEAIADLIDADTAAQMKAAHRQHSGSLKADLHEILLMLAEAKAMIDLWADFSEELESFEFDRHHALLSTAQTKLNRILARGSDSYRLKKGIHVVLTGEPNVGKSSLFNAIIGRERAIVTAIPGTTRDVLEVTLELNGIPFHFSDTAGIRESQEEIERIGIERARSAVADADIVIAIGIPYAKASEPLSPSVLIVTNKIDTGPAAPGSIGVSALTGEGVPELTNRIAAFASANLHTMPYCLNDRHLENLSFALSAVQAAEGVFLERRPIDLAASCLDSASQAIMALTGQSLTPEDMATIFSRFCVGK